MGQLTFLLDSGHGGIVDGKYTTAPNFDKNDKSTWKKSWYHPEKDLSFFEGVYNRQIINLVKQIMNQSDMKYIDVVNSEYDISLPDRVQKANDFYHGNKDCFYFSMHGNAAGSGKAHGIEIFTSKGETTSDKYATIMMEQIICAFPEERIRADYSDGDIDKEANFYVLKKTAMPAVLLEMFFFDNIDECIKMTNMDTQIRIANSIVDGFRNIQDYVNQD